MHLSSTLAAVAAGSMSGALLAGPAAAAIARRPGTDGPPSIDGLPAGLPDRDPTASSGVNRSAGAGRAPGDAVAGPPRDAPDDKRSSRDDSTPWRLAAVTGLCCGALAGRLGAGWTLLPYLPLGLLGPALGAVDRATYRLPDRWIALLALGTTAAMAAAFVATRPAPVATVLVAVLGGAALLGGTYLALALARPGALGLGDVKLAAVLGGCLAWPALPRLLDGAAAGLGLAALAGARVLVRDGRRDARLALGPHLIAGAVLALIVPPLPSGG